jgi:tetratricopeptide (TPR) repeat protein
MSRPPTPDANPAPPVHVANPAPPAPAPAPAHVDARRQALVVALVLGVAAVLRIAYVLQYLAVTPFADAVISDSAFYDAWARRVLAGEGYGPAPYYMAPLYPYLLAALYAVAGHSLAAVAWIQSALGLVNLWMVYRLGRRLDGHATGLLAMLLAMLYGPLMFLEAKPLTETVAIALALASLTALSGALRRPGVARFAGVGALLGLSCLARPNMLMATAAIGAFLGVRWLLRRPGPRFAHLAAMGVALLATIAPVTVRNAVVGGDRALITTNAGIVFAQGNHAASDGIATVLPGFTTRIEDQQAEELARAAKALGRPVKPSESSRHWMRQGWRFAAEHPLDFLGLWARKALWTLHAREARDVHNPDYEARHIPMLGLLALPFPLLAGLGLYGFLALRRRGAGPDAWIAALYVLSILAGLVIFSVSFRYRAPAAPVLAIFAAAGLAAAARAVRERGARALAAPLLCTLPILAVSLVPYPIARVTAETPSNWGAAYLMAGNVDRAVAHSLEALELNPNLASAHYNLGLAFHRVGDREQALAAFRQVVRIRPDDAQARHNLATMLDESGRTEEAIAEYEAALALRPDMARTRYNLALALFQAGRYPQAREALDAARAMGVAADPAFVRALARRLEAVAPATTGGAVPGPAGTPPDTATPDVPSAPGNAPPRPPDDVPPPP